MSESNLYAEGLYKISEGVSLIADYIKANPPIAKKSTRKSTKAAQGGVYVPGTESVVTEKVIPSDSAVTQIPDTPKALISDEALIQVVQGIIAADASKVPTIQAIFKGFGADKCQDVPQDKREQIIVLLKTL